LRLTVVGANGAVPRAGGASSSYLVEHLGTRLLIDCGSGAYAQLQRHANPFQLQGVVISHLHPDHIFDLVPFRYALTYALGGRPEPVALHVPPQGRQMLDVFAQSWGSPPGFFEEVFAVQEYDPAQTLAIGELTISFQQMQHYIPSFGMRVTGDAVLAYSSDTGMADVLYSLAANAALFLCEATAQESTYEQVKAGHLSAGDAARVAAQARARRLVLTHVWHELDPTVSLAEAQAVFGGEISVAEEGRSYDIGA
jgi:ribonuclease BN (tRNA processing enzyme)